MKNCPLTKKESSAFIKRLKLLKKQLKLQHDTHLANFIGMPPRTLHSWFLGDAQPSSESVANVENQLQFRLARLHLECRAVSDYFSQVNPATEPTV